MLHGQQRVYFMGNSFTQYSWPYYFDGDTKIGDEDLLDSSKGGDIGWSLTWGKTLDFAVKNPSVEHSGPDWDVSLSTQSWDVVVMQPHTFDAFLPFQEEADAVKTIIETARAQNPDTIFYILGAYAWMEGPDKVTPDGRAFRDNWTDDYPRNQVLASFLGWQGNHKTLFNVKRDFEALFFDKIRAENPDADIRWIPLGEVIHDLDLELQSLAPEHPLKSTHNLHEAWDLITDEVHLGRLTTGIDGTYIAHMTVLSTIWKGNPDQFQTVYDTGITGYPGSDIWPVLEPINPDFKALVDPIIWTVVTRYLTRYYVDQDATSGANDGSSWSNAFIHLQDALSAAAITGGEIWVAEGTYYPDDGADQSDGDRNATFQIHDNVKIYGGFKGAETLLAQRIEDPDTNGTVLSGDLLQDDGMDFSNTDDNAYHVVTGSGANLLSALSGFTITGGNAADSGGGFYSDQGGYTVVSLCRFTHNSAQSSGGAIYLSEDSDIKLFNCVLDNNRVIDADGRGGALYGEIHSDPIVRQCSFTGNTAGYGGAIFTNNGAGMSVLHCSFNGNSAKEDGGVMYRETYTNSRFYEIINSEFSSNSAGNKGGAIFSNSNLAVTNGTFAANEASQGGAIFIADGNLSLSNSILWGNSADTDSQLGGSLHSSSTKNLIQGGTVNGTTIISNSDPIFIRNPDPDNETYGILRLQIGSPAIDQGEMDADLDAYRPNNPYGPEDAAIEDVKADLWDNPRIQNDTIDLGAYELDPFYRWMETRFPPATDPDQLGYWADADGDNISNVLEWYLGLDPVTSETRALEINGRTFESVGLPILYLDADNEESYKVIFERASNLADLGFRYTVQFSSNLQDWFDSEVEPSLLDTDGILDLVSVPVPELLPDESRVKFIRLRAELIQ